MEVKFGKIVPNGLVNSNIFIEASAGKDDNFFASENGSNLNQKNADTPSSGVRINDFDSNILENNAYQTIADDMFKIEHKIGILEEVLSKLDNEIEALNSLGEVIQISELIERKKKVELELAEMNKKYSELGLSAKISGQIASVASFTSKNKNSLEKFKKLISKNVLAKISKKFNYSQNMKDALDKLSNINLSVDELINMQVPYGETSKRYEKLTAYLNKANVIHSQISRNINSSLKKA